MKGIVFTEFLEMVEEKFGFEMADDIVTNTQLESKGVYTAVGTYSHLEMVSLISALSKKTNISEENLMLAYGEYLFGRFAVGYPSFFSKVKNSFDFLSSVENYIHKEVFKLYPDAELPSFIITQPTKNELIMRYLSARAMYSFAHGLIKGCLSYFKDGAKVEFEKNLENGTDVTFRVTR